MFSWKRCAALSVAGIMICSAAGLLVLSSKHVRGDDANRTTQQAAQKNTQQQEKNADDQVQPNSKVKLQGRGRQASEKFYLQPGVLNFDVTHDGTSNLIIRLLDENGKEIDTVFNQIGNFRGDRTIPIAKAGRFLFDVAADGNWAIAISQPETGEAQRTPVSFQGTGFHATQFVQLKKGLNIFKLKHDGEMRFRVTLLDQYGQPVESLVNTVGDFDGSKPVSIDEPGLYYLNVGADGDWSIDVE
jgi:hypothetical protein